MILHKSQVLPIVLFLCTLLDYLSMYLSKWIYLWSIRPKLKSQLAVNEIFFMFTGMVKVPSARLIDFTRSASLDESDLQSLTLWSNASIHITENPISESVVCWRLWCSRIFWEHFWEIEAFIIKGRLVYAHRVVNLVHCRENGIANWLCILILTHCFFWLILDSSFWSLIAPVKSHFFSVWYLLSISFLL